MQNTLTGEDYKNILALISRANITGQEATATAILQQKLSSLIKSQEVEPAIEPTEDGK